MQPMPDILDRPLPALAGDHPLLAFHRDCLRLLAERLDDRAVLSPPGLLDGLTTLSMLREAETLCMDLIERPGDVLRVSTELNERAIEAHQALWRTLTEVDGAQSVAWTDIYAPGRCEMVQCDFAMMLSPAMFEQFVVPYLRRMGEYMDYCCYHLDGTGQIRHAEHIFSVPAVKAIQWNPEPPAPPPLEWLDFFREVRRCGRSLWVASDVDTCVGLTRELGPDGLMLWLKGVETVEQLRRALERIERAVD
jgi:hypothetical protein